MEYRDYLIELIGDENAHLLEGMDEDPSIVEPVLWKALEGLVFEPEQDPPVVRYPSRIHGPAAARECLDALENGTRWAIEEHGESWALVPAADGADDPARRRFLLDFFARLNGYPSHSHIDLAAYQPAKSPLLSCIVVLTLNDEFCRHRLLPSILANSAGVDLEIVVVHNGVGANLEALTKAMPNVQVVYAEFLSPSSAYNRGVQHARGEYVAIFHDDCLLHDEHWLETCLNKLHAPCTAVSADVRPAAANLQVPKSVPMVLRRSDYLALGGHDVGLFSSFEEIDFLLKILSAGKTVEPVDLACTHFRGMSSYLLFGTRPAFAKTLFAYLVLPYEYMRALANTVVNCVMVSRLGKMLHGSGLQVVVSRYPEYFPAPTKEAQAELEARAVGNKESDREATLALQLEQFHQFSHLSAAARKNPLKRKMLAAMLARRDTTSAPADA